MTAIYVPPRIRVTDYQGMPVRNARVWFYQAGTTILKPVYQDTALTMEHENPVPADSAGLLPVIYLSGTYKIRQTTAEGVQIHPEVDNLDAPLSSTGGFLGVPQGGTGGNTPETARAGIGAAAQDTLDALGSAVGNIQATINGYPTFGALAAKDKVEPGDFSAGFAPVCIQRLRLVDNVRRSLSGIIPIDNTQPLRNEGDTLFTQIFTPKNGASIIRVTANISISVNGRPMVLTLFNTTGATDPAIAASSTQINTTAADQLFLMHEFTVSGTNPITIQLNCGSNGAYAINGTLSAGLFNGLTLSTLIIEEYL